MAGISTGPSFMSRLGNFGAGATNALAQQFGGDLSGAARGSSALLGRQQQPRRPQMPQIRNGIPGEMPGQKMPLPTMPPPVGGGPINTAPSMMTPEMLSGMSTMGFGGGGGIWNPMAPKLDPSTGQYSTPNNGMGGIFGRFNRMGGQGQSPFGYRF